MQTETWKKSDNVVVATGSLEPRSPVGSMYLVLDESVYIMTWRGKSEWESIWKMTDKLIKFVTIDTPEGTVIDWGSKKSLKRFIPLRHFAIAEEIGKQEGKFLYDWEMFE